MCLDYLSLLLLLLLLFSFFGGGDYILWALRKLIMICLGNYGQNQRGNWLDCIRSPSAGEMRRCMAAVMRPCAALELGSFTI